MSAKPNYAHITPLLFALHWLPIGSWIQYRIALTCFLVVSGSGTYYSSSIPLQCASSLYKLLHLYSASHSFCLESNTPIFLVLRIGKRTPGKRCFQINTSVLSRGTKFSVFFFLSGILFHSLLLIQAKTENRPLLFCILILLVLLPSTNPSLVMLVFCNVSPCVWYIHMHTTDIFCMHLCSCVRAWT